MKKITVLTGAGVSKESGIETFRDGQNSLWNNHKIESVATKEAWHVNRDNMLEFYNQRRRLLNDVEPNEAHLALSRLQDYFDVELITQNVDDLHERAGSKKIIHLHGELTKARSEMDGQDTDNVISIGYEDIKPGDLAPDGSQMRPHIVWFGEDVPLLQKSADLVYDADILIIIGTSFTVYPATSLMTYAKSTTPVFIIDPSNEPPLAVFKHAVYKEGVSTFGKYTHYKLPATVGMKMLEEFLKNQI